MFDIWGFLLQTLSVSGVAALILLIKHLFQDKLPPKWQFAVWGILGMVMMIPAGMGGRYLLFRWQIAVETVIAWLRNNEEKMDRVIFNVFSEKDRGIYEQLLN